MHSCDITTQARSITSFQSRYSPPWSYPQADLKNDRQAYHLRKNGNGLEELGQLLREFVERVKLEHCLFVMKRETRQFAHPVADQQCDMAQILTAETPAGMMRVLDHATTRQHQFAGSVHETLT